MPKIIGIDLGTTYSAVSIWDERKKTPVIIPNLRGDYTTPSVVSLNDSGEVIVGADAKQNFVMNPQNTVFQIKREMGRDFPVTMGGKTYNPQTISAFILRYLKMSAEKYLNEPVHDAVITVPAYFTEVQHSATRDAGMIAGLNVHQLVNEPTAAAIAYGVKSSMKPGESKLYAVYDLGGGTFDVSVIEITAEDITVVGTGGDSRLGGLDMDEEMMKWTLRQIQARHNVDLSGDDAVRRRLMVEVEDVKKRLVAGETTDLNVPFLTMVNGQPFSFKISITRSQYEMLIQKLLDRSMVCLDEAVASAKKKNNMGWEKLDGALLVGGPTRIQRIRDMIRDKFQQKFREHGCPDRPFEIKCDLNPDEVVAMGAAIVAAVLVPIGKAPEEVERMKPEELEKTKAEAKAKFAPGSAPVQDIYDVTGHSLGIALEGVKFHPIIEKEEVIPVAHEHGPFSNAADMTTELLVEVYQGEDQFVAGNTKIGEVRISGLEPLPKGRQMVKVEFHLDSSGTLSTKCTDMRTNKVYQSAMKFDGVTRMSKEEIQKKRQAVSEAMAYRAPAQAAPAPKTGPGPAGPPPADAPLDLPDDRVPKEWKVYWDTGRGSLGSLTGEARSKVLAAMQAFAQAVLSGDPGAIERKGYVLQDTIMEVRQ